MVSIIDRKSGGFSDYVYQFVALSTDTKPKATNGSTLEELDTGRKFRYNKEEESWIGDADKYLKAIAVKTAPTKTTYTEGDIFDDEGLTVEATYTDATTAMVETFTIKCDQPLNVGSAVTLRYEENGIARYVDVPITVEPAPEEPEEPVVEKTLSSISLEAPTKTTYVAGETLDITGAVVTATYSDDTTADVTEQATFSPADGATLTVENTRLTVSYTEGGVTKTSWKTLTVTAE